MGFAASDGAGRCRSASGAAETFLAIFREFVELAADFLRKLVVVSA